MVHHASITENAFNTIKALCTLSGRNEGIGSSFVIQRDASTMQLYLLTSTQKNHYDVQEVNKESGRRLSCMDSLVM